MWILPRQLHTSAFVPDTEALISDSTEQSQICAQSLLARSKPSPARTWSQRWKRDSWTQHLSGRILKPSHGQTFVTAWTSSLAATRANPSAQPASDSAPKTQDTSGRTYQPELLSCDQQYVSLRMSKDISRWGCPTLSKTWADWVTERRGAWRARVSAVRLTRGKESGSWPSVTTKDHHSQGSGNNQKSPSLATTLEKNWPTVTAFDFNNTPLNRIDGTGRTYKSNLKEAVHQNWPSPRSNMHKEASMGCCGGRIASTGYHANIGEAVWLSEYGQAAPASSNTLGSRQGLSWMTPRACEAQNPPMGVDKRHHGLTHQVTKQWATPRGYQQAGPDQNRINRPNSGGDDLVTQIAKVQRNMTAKLNPRWVETLMGLPIGWTMPSCIRPVTIAPTSCDSSGMALCQPLQSEPSDFFLAS